MKFCTVSLKFWKITTQKYIKVKCPAFAVKKETNFEKKILKKKIGFFSKKNVFLKKNFSQFGRVFWLAIANI